MIDLIVSRVNNQFSLCLLLAVFITLNNILQEKTTPHYKTEINSFSNRWSQQQLLFMNWLNIRCLIWTLWNKPVTSNKNQVSTSLYTASDGWHSLHVLDGKGEIPLKLKAIWVMIPHLKNAGRNLNRGVRGCLWAEESSGRKQKQSRLKEGFSLSFQIAVNC